jgi:two-component system, LytTR family, response regulator
VFATSYDDHAMEAFNANAVAYLLKPIELPRLTAVLDRLRRILPSDGDRVSDQRSVLRLATQARNLDRIVGRKQGRLLLLRPVDILWFQLDQGIVRAHTQESDYWANYQLNELEQALDGAMFFRARREILVNLSQVKSLRSHEGSTFALVMNDPGETQIIVSERRAKDLRTRFPGL